MNQFPSSASRKWIAERVRQIRIERYGENGGPVLAKAMGIPFHCWASYEAGVTMPSEVLLRFIQVTNSNPNWFLTNLDEKYVLSDRDSVRIRYQQMPSRGQFNHEARFTEVPHEREK
jgi:hypothetical protein